MSTTTSPESQDTHVPMPAWSLARVLLVWALATAPMGLAAWVAAPLLADTWDGPLPLMRALIICLTVGLAWQSGIVAWTVRRERGSLSRRTLADALWLRRPHGPRSGRTGGRVWWMLVPAAVALIALQAVPQLPHNEARDLSLVLLSDDGAAFFEGAWGWLALVALLLVLNTFIGEELLFRGLLLPRMVGRFGRFAWLANTLLFAAYHVHQPWSMPNVLVSSTVFTYTTQRYRSAWFGVILHSLQAVVALTLVLGLVLGIEQ